MDAFPLFYFLIEVSRTKVTDKGVFFFCFSNISFFCSYAPPLINTNFGKFFIGICDIYLIFYLD